MDSAQKKALLETLSARFEKNMSRHVGINWADVEKKLTSSSKKLKVLLEMENTGGEPDVIGFDKNSGEFIFCDCAAESPAGRRSLCYDPEALDARKQTCR